jgi:hypothetical protein
MEWNKLWKGARQDERMVRINKELAVSIRACYRPLQLTSSSTS